MKMKTWQILVLAGGGLATFCLVCIAGTLIVSLALPTSSEGSASLDPVPTIGMNVLPVAPETMTKIPPSPTAIDTPTLLPSETTVPSLTPIPVEAFGGFAGCIPNNPRETGMVTKVIDGDTIEVVIREIPYTVRYIGIDTPEMQGELYAAEATQFNKTLVEGKFVSLVKDVSETDRYDRQLRYVVADGLFVNYELVKQGYAYAKDYPPDSACSLVLQAAQAEAQTAGRMLWSQNFASLSTASAMPVMNTPITRSGGVEVAPCNCNGPDLNCKDFTTQASAQSCWNYCRAQGFANPHNLDGSDHDGRVCETLP